MIYNKNFKYFREEETNQTNISDLFTIQNISLLAEKPSNYINAIKNKD
jgi:hypothetical protein